MRKLLDSPWQTLSIPSALTPIGQLHQSPPSPVPGDLGGLISSPRITWSVSCRCLTCETCAPHTHTHTHMWDLLTNRTLKKCDSHITHQRNWETVRCERCAYDTYTHVRLTHHTHTKRETLTPRTRENMKHLRCVQHTHTHMWDSRTTHVTDSHTKHMSDMCNLCIYIYK